MRGPDFAVLGLGYVGLPLALAASAAGLAVVGYDKDDDKVRQLKDGKSHVGDISDGEVAAALERGFVPSSDPDIVASARAYAICVPTPLNNRQPDLDAVLAAAEIVGSHLDPEDLVVLESTSYPGTTEEVVQPVLERRSGLHAGTDFYLVFSPERIDPGNSTWTLKNTPKIIGGEPRSVQVAEALYGKFCEDIVVVNGTREAEMSKLIENTYRLVNIALVNELARVARQHGVDIAEAIRAAATKPFGFQRFDPGPGIGGHCIPVDPVYLSWWAHARGSELALVDLALAINDAMPGHVASRIEDLLAAQDRKLRGAEILLVGVAYKPGVEDIRETPATSVARHLLSQGARLSYADPLVREFTVDAVSIERVQDAAIAAKGVDLVVVLTPHPDLDLEAIAEAAPAILDTRGVMKPEKAWHL